MKIISHRGNLSGRSDCENQPARVDAALEAGFDVEIDVRMFGNEFYLGHDRPEYRVEYEWLVERADRLWLHCKDLDSLTCLRYSPLNYFAHQTDSCVLTSMRHVWTYPGQLVDWNSVLVLEAGDPIPKICYGVCTDYPFSVRDAITRLSSP